MQNRYCNITCLILLFVNVAALGLLSGCQGMPKSSEFLNSLDEHVYKAQALQPSYNVNANGRTVLDVWNDTIEKHALSKENIVLTESLLTELGADSIILSSNDQIRMNKSLDRYLQQFGHLFKKFDKKKSNPREGYYLEKKTNPSEGACYWLAWMIARGAREEKVTQEQKKEIRASYESFTNEIVSSIEESIYSPLDPDERKKFAPYITESINWLNTRFDEYYTELHDDFLFPGFDKPLDEKIKKEAASQGHRVSPKPNAIASDESSISVERRYLRQLEFRVRPVPKLVLWARTWLSLEDVVLNKTEEWGYMKFSTRSSAKKGIWPILIQISPEVQVNKDKRLGRWKKETIK